MRVMPNLKFGRLGNISWLTLSRRVSSWPELESSHSGTMCKYDKCFIPIMKWLSTSNGGMHFWGSLSVNVNRHKCRHLLIARRTFSIEGPFLQLRVMSVVFSAGSSSAKSLRVRWVTSIWSISTWRQLLTICEEVSSVVLKLEAINVTSFSWVALSTQTYSSFSFFRQLISLWKLFGSSVNSTCKAWTFKQTERNHLANAEREKWCDYKMKIIFIISVTSRDTPKI